MNPLPHPRSLACAALLTFLALTCGHSQTVPALVNYQGRLANPDGSPLPTADYTLTFNLYDAATNGARVWGPQVFDAAVAQGHGARVPVVQGYFNVMLGPVDTNGISLADAFNGTSRCVEVTVSNRPPIAPRQQILTTPFAFQAANSAKLAGYDWSAVFGTNNPAAGQIPTAKISDGAVTFAKLAPRQVGTNAGIGGLALSANTGTNTWESPTPSVPTLITNLLVTLATRGGPVMVFLTDGGPDSAVTLNSSAIEVERPTGDTEVGLFLEVLRNGQHVGTYFHTDSVGTAPYTRIVPSVFRLIDFSAPAGTYVYSIRAWYGPATAVRFVNVRLAAFEL